MKVALVHDYLNEFGGAERVLLAMSEIWPNAPIYTAFYRQDSPAWERFKDRDVRVSWVHHVPGFATKLHSPLRFLAPAIWNSFDFSSYDVIISSSSWYVTKGFARKGKAIEICYCHTPPRWLYGYATSMEWQRYAPLRAYAAVVGFFMRHYDYEAAQRVNYFIANSQETAQRIKKFYRRESEIIYPPIDTELRTQNSMTKRKYYLVVSRLAQSKNIELAIAAVNKLKVPLKIVGTGPDESRLKALAGPTIEFLGYVSDRDLPRLYAGAKAFLALAIDEDFGMTPVEAMAMGTPVIAYRGGGYVESVVEGKTGIFFDNPTVESLVSALKNFSKIKKDWASECQKQAQKFNKERFKKELKTFVEGKVHPSSSK